MLLQFEVLPDTSIGHPRTFEDQRFGKLQRIEHCGRTLLFMEAYNSAWRAYCIIIGYMDDPEASTEVRMCVEIEPVRKEDRVTTEKFMKDKFHYPMIQFFS